MPLRMAGKRQMMLLAVEPQHQGWMKATWNKGNLSFNICTVFHARQLLQKSESFQPVFTIPTNSVGKLGFVQSGFKMCSTMTKEPNVFLLPLICSIGEMKPVHPLVVL
jgi:hypothetical protein